MIKKKTRKRAAKRSKLGTWVLKLEKNGKMKNKRQQYIKNTWCGGFDYAASKESPIDLFSTVFRLCVQIDPEVATNDVTKAGVSSCRMSWPRRLVAERPAKSTSERECHCRPGVPTPSCRNVRRLPSWTAIFRRTGVRHIHHGCCYATRIAASDSMAPCMTSSGGNHRGTTFWGAVNTTVQVAF